MAEVREALRLRSAMRASTQGRGGPPAGGIAMEPIRLSDVLRATGGELAGPVDGDPFIPAVTTDSRIVPPGRSSSRSAGKKLDAHQFVEQAFLHGAGFSLAARDADLARVPSTVIRVTDTTKALGDLARWHRSRFDVPVVGVTGSCGKTTTKEMLRLVLGRNVVASPASFNNEIGVPLTLLQMDRHGGRRRRDGRTRRARSRDLAGIAPPTVGVVTNVEEAHLEGWAASRRDGGEERPARALPDGAAIVNADNYWCRERWRPSRPPHHLRHLGGQRHLRARARVRPPTASPSTSTARCSSRSRRWAHNVPNALAAIATGLWLGSARRRADALTGYRAPPMRGARGRGEVVLVNDAYNANPRDGGRRERARQRPARGRPWPCWARCSSWAPTPSVNHRGRRRALRRQRRAARGRRRPRARLPRGRSRRELVRDRGRVPGGAARGGPRRQRRPGQGLAPILDQLETDLRVPIVASSLARMWDILSQLGLTYKIPGYGTLLANWPLLPRLEKV